MPRHGLNLGLSLAVADFDGDGFCDAAAGTINFNLDGRGNDGLIQIFQGTAPSDDPDYPDPGGLVFEPVKYIVMGSEGGRSTRFGSSTRHRGL